MIEPHAGTNADHPGGSFFVARTQAVLAAIRRVKRRVCLKDEVSLPREPNRVLLQCGKIVATEPSELLLASASEESWFSDEKLDGGGSPWLLAKQEKESTKESTKTSRVLTMPRSGFREQLLQDMSLHFAVVESVEGRKLIPAA